GSLPVMLGPEFAARTASVVMIVPQLVVAALLMAWGRAGHGIAIVVICLLQVILMRRLLSDPRRYAPWYNSTGIGLLVLGMMIAAAAIRSLPAS
ncbi:MAG TPA: bacteriochlorophyll/chlorophyll a synthase, partial [Hyphomicrobiaceae bacterium]|nr:bacteriochlorophyll/chlorophyll a synthase [Hyphomicrobiaceae bacterium]